MKKSFKSRIFLKADFSWWIFHHDRSVAQGAGDWSLQRDNQSLFLPATILPVSVKPPQKTSEVKRFLLRAEATDGVSGELEMKEKD